jgi:hypothetical protein
MCLGLPWHADRQEERVIAQQASRGSYVKSDPADGIIRIQQDILDLIGF